MSVNKLILVGRAGIDPEVKVLESGVTVTKFTMATGRKYKTKSGEEKDGTQWHRIVCFNKLAEIAGEYVKKGKQVYIEGEVQYRSWEDKDGKTCYITEVMASSMQLLGDSKTATTEEITPRSSIAEPKNPKGKNIAEKYGVKNYAPGAPPTTPDENFGF